MKPKEFEVIYKFTVAPTVPFPSALNWNTEPIGELIRCKECRYWWKEYGLCKHPKTCEECGPDFYCGYAERKEE